MRPFIIGTAGHVDHGKTSLIQFLTGVNTDRLIEEQERGITIELGFAPIRIERQGRRITAGIVDVPGHERFVKHMVAGAGGVDLVLMVIAADEGVMPQTREHLDICRLLDVKVGIVVVTKVDLVEGDWLGLVEEDVRESLRGTFLEDAPIVTFSKLAADPQAQRRAVEDAIWAAHERVAGRDRDAVFRLPLDRIFTLRGHGTVVTGTIVGGHIRIGDELAIVPGDVPARVRSIQSFGAALDEASAGMRAALNVAGMEKADLERGMVAIRPGTLQPTDLLDAQLTYLPHNPKPLADRASALLHVGSAHTTAVVQLLEEDGAPVPPGEQTLVRLHLAEPVVALPGDHYILRGFADIPGHGKTLGGGTVLHLSGGPYRVAYKGERLRSYLRDLAVADERERLRLVLRAVGHAGLDAPALGARTGIGPRQLEALLAELDAAGAIHPVDEQPRQWLDDEVVRATGGRIREIVTTYLKENPLEEGVAREQVRSQLRPPIGARALTTVLERLREGGVVTLDRDLVGLPGRSAKLEGKDAALAEQMDAAIREGGLAPPRIEQLAEQAGTTVDRVRGVVNLLLRRGRLVRVADGLFYAPEPLDELRRQMLAWFETNEELTTQQFKDLTGLTRRWLIPLAEFFDQEKLTVRRGEARVRRK
jgi:selenocysteine-specific elongation factor